jgi:hypothetical protein
MKNPRFSRYLASMKDKGWFATGHDPDSIVDDNFAQFFTFFPHDQHMVMASMSVDRFYQFVSDTKSTVPAYLLERERLVDFLCSAAHETKGHKSLDKEALWAMSAALYMSVTSTGNTVMTRYHGSPFAFFTVMYPSNKSKTDFAVRPASAAPIEHVLSVQESHDYCQQIMQADKQAGKKAYFKYLK